MDVYKRPLNEKFPVLCMDESPKQLIGETKTPIAASPGQVAKYDYEYKRYGVCNVFMASEPLAGKRLVKITERKTKIDWAYFLEDIAALYTNAEKIILVMDNFGTHTPGALYEAFPPVKAKLLRDRFDFVFTPKHGSWLNMAEIEFSILSNQCLDKRIPDQDTLRQNVIDWVKSRNNIQAQMDWQFTTQDARIKLKRLYPSI